jgi:hypothetical protein
MQWTSPTACSSSFTLVVFTNSIDVWKWQLIPDANWQSPVAATIFPLPPSSASVSTEAMSRLSHAGILFKNAGASWRALEPCPSHTAYFGTPIPSMPPAGFAASDEVATAEVLGAALVMAGALDIDAAFVFGGSRSPLLHADTSANTAKRENEIRLLLTKSPIGRASPGPIATRIS